VRSRRAILWNCVLLCVFTHLNNFCFFLLQMSSELKVSVSVCLLRRVAQLSLSVTSQVSYAQFTARDATRPNRHAASIYCTSALTENLKPEHADTESSIGPFCVTRSIPTYELTDPTQPNPLQMENFGPTRPNPVQIAMELTV